MKRVEIAELESQLARYLRAVEAGAEIEVTDGSRPIARIARIVPARPAQAVSIEPAEVPVASLRSQRQRPARWRLSSLTLLLQERRRCSRTAPVATRGSRVGG